MYNELDKYGRPYKCGPNYVPDWLFNEPLFQPCCKQHDIDWTEQKGKFKSDVRLFKCCWSKARLEPRLFWRLRDKTQAIVMFIILISNPLSYIMYLWQKK